MTDSELSLSVAKIMYPDSNWYKANGGVMNAMNGTCTKFNYFTDDALGKMVVWLANNREVTDNHVQALLEFNNPHKEIALAILEVSK